MVKPFRVKNLLLLKFRFICLYRKKNLKAKAIKHLLKLRKTPRLS